MAFSLPLAAITTLKTRLHPALPGRRVLVALLAAHLLALLVLAAAPGWHHALHGDADAADHDCAVVLFAHGQADPVAGPAAVPAFAVQAVGCVPLALTAGVFVPPLFVTDKTAVRGPPLPG